MLLESLANVNNTSNNLQNFTNLNSSDLSKENPNNNLLHYNENNSRNTHREEDLKIGSDAININNYNHLSLLNSHINV